MAKVSTNPITSYEQDWGKDQSNDLPYSGEAVQKFIKDELKSKLNEADAETKVREQLKSQLFGGGTNNVVTEVDGNSEVLTITSRNSDGNSTTKDINIGMPDANDRFVTVTTRLSKQYVNVGGDVELALGFTVSDYQGELIPGSYANAVIEVSRQGSANPFYRSSLGTIVGAVDSASPNHSVDLTNILASNITGSASLIVTVAINYTYSYTDENGVQKSKTITKYGTTTLTVLSLSLSTSINIANTGMFGQISIPYTVKGNGSKTVYLYRDGELVDQHDDLTGASVSKVFTQNLTGGLTNFQIVAETSAGDTTVRSSSFYFDLFGSSMTTIIAFKVEDATGVILNKGDYETPEFSAARFTDFKFNYYVYNINQSSVDVDIIVDEFDDSGIVTTSTSAQTLNRKLYTYSKKIKTSNDLVITFDADTVKRMITVKPRISTINIEPPVENLKLNLDSDGRSNEEVNRDVWSYGNVTTDFEGFNWQSNGWINNTLLLQNGAKATVNFPLFQDVQGYPVTKNGCAFEILFKCDNATLDEHDIISCYWETTDGKRTGLNITTSYVGVDTGEVTEYKDDDGKVTQSVVTRVGSQYAQGNWYKYIFVIDPNAPGVGANKGLCYGYLNGILSYIAPMPTSFVNLDKLPIVIDSTYADVYLKSIKYYDSPLTHDQCVDESIIDQETSSEIEELYNKNNVLGRDERDNEYMSPQKLRAMGKGVMIISPSAAQTTPTKIQDLNKSSDKKSYYGPFRVDYFAPANDINLGYTSVPVKGNPFNFTHTECAVRVQGTTSTKRPRKNYRLHFNKKDGDNKPSAGSFIVGGEVRDSFKYAMSQDAVAVPIACLKVDYVDSSMTHNTGGAVIFNEMTRNVESLRNPAQQREYVNSSTDIKTRVAIEGFPIDVFAADSVVNPEYTDTLEDSNYTGLQYMGQYNFNNDKSKSGAVFGFDGSYTYNADGEYDETGQYQPICLEFLDNNADLDLFRVKFTTGGNINEAATYSGFADALEVRAPEDVTDQVADHGLDSLATATGFEKYRYVPTQVKRIFNFIGECAKQVAQNNNITVSSLNNMDSDGLEALNWESEKFINEAPDYFILASVLAWYIWTDYTIAVDQRAKNMMMYTMDGKHWMFQYYDGDTMFGERNDCFLAYDYLTDRDTYDDAVKQYAMQGHDSWLWHLVRANFTDQKVIDGTPDPRTAVNLTSVCKLMRNSGKFSADYFKQIFNGQFVNNWSQRQYNYSQDYKYIQPLTETGYPSDISTNFINTAQGSREAHRTYTIENRFALLDSKYQAGNYSQDAFVYYAAANNTNKLKIVSSIPYYFGWNTSNTSIREHQAATANNDYTVNLTIVGNSANNPANVLGASRIKELYFDANSAWTVDSSKDVKLPNLTKLVASGMGSKAVGDLYLTECPLLSYVDLSGSTFSGLYGLERCSKLTYLNIEDTDIRSVKFAEGSPVSTVKLGIPYKLFLSNLKELRFNNDENDTLTAVSWDGLDSLLLNNCPNIDWEKMLSVFHNSSPVNKYLRITGIEKEVDITWLDQFEKYYGLDENGNQVVSGAQLQGTLYLKTYTDDETVERYRAKYGNNGLLDIRQPEYTLIEADEMIADETKLQGPNKTTYNTNYTNLDNNTGARYGTRYVPSGHLTNIFNRVHRYLGKLQDKGGSKKWTVTEFANDTYGSFDMRDGTGTMLLIQLDDDDSNYYKYDYYSGTRTTVNLTGLQGNGEVWVKIPAFWYKGINYNVPYDSTISKRYTCISAQETKPSVSDEIEVIKIEDLKNTESYGDVNGTYKLESGISHTQVANNIDNRITKNVNYTVMMVNVKGYKKIMFPGNAGEFSAVFTDADGNIITNSDGEVQGYGEVFYVSGTFISKGMPVLATIPPEAEKFYFALHTDCVPQDIVMHKGTKFNSGDDMTDENAKDWIADMEPDWQYSPVTLVAAAAAYSSDKINLYTRFDYAAQPVKGTKDGAVDDIGAIGGDYFYYGMSRAAYKRGLQLVDYTFARTIAMLFVAKYGRRRIQAVLGNVNNGTGYSYAGNSKNFGMRDSVLKEGDTGTSLAASHTKDGVTYYNEYYQGHTFLGIESVIDDTRCWMDGLYYLKPAEIAVGGLEFDYKGDPSPHYSPLNGSGYGGSKVHGKNCSIETCYAKGSNTTYYTDYSQPGHISGLNLFKNVRIAALGGGFGGHASGVFGLVGGADSSVGYAGTFAGSRLLFRGNVIETQSIEEFENAEEVR